MPFTFAHPAIVMPLSKSRFGLSVTGLVVGSMVPDFEFILRMRTGENIGHHWTGLLLFDVPLAVLLSFVFHQYVRDGLIQHLPYWYRVRLSRFMQNDWVAYARANPAQVLLSILIGIGSHLFLDAFTHSDGGFVTLIPYLQHEVTLGQQHLPVYLILQCISSAWGLGLVYRFMARMPVGPAAVIPDNPAYWSIIAPIAIDIFLIRMLLLPDYQRFWDTVFAGMGSIIYALLAVSMLRALWKRPIWQEQ